MPANIVYFDLETQRSANDVGGWANKHKMGMSVGVTYSTARGTYRIYSEARAEELIEELRRADLVVGFNVRDFDLAVLMGYTCLHLPELIVSLDLLVDLEKRLGNRIGLDALSQATLGVGKIAEGYDALRWWREGRLLQIAEYCCFDVKVTRMVHEFGARNGHVLYHDRQGRLKKVQVAWSLPGN